MGPVGTAARVGAGTSVGRVLAGTVLLLAALLASALPLAFRQPLIDAAYVVSSTAVAVCALRASRRAEGAARRGWLLMAVTGGCWAAGNLTWSWLQLVASSQPFPSLADAFYLAALPPLVLAVLYLHEPPASLAGRVRLGFDGLLCALCLSFVSWVLVVHPLWALPGGSSLNRVVVVAYPVADVVLAALALGLTISSRLDRTATRLLVAALLLYCLADTNLALATLRGTYVTGTTLDAAWVASYAAIAYAAATWRPAPAAPVRSGSAAAAAAPYVPVLLAILAAACVELSPSQDPTAVALGVAALVVTGLRQGAVLRENAVLRGDLEHLVQARTGELEASRLELEHRAYHDPLTGLVNRTLLHDRLGQALTRLARTGGATAVLLLDLDDFKTTNDTLGHGTGDALLVAVAARLHALVRDQDTLARLGGDEFAIVVDRVDELPHVSALPERVLAGFAEPFEVEGHRLVVGLSIGVALAGAGDEAQDVLRHADVALYQSKGTGKNRFTVFEAEMHDQVLDRMRLKSDLRRAVDGGEFVVHYQPIVALATGEVCGVEALARWQHPERGTVGPADFIELAEETGAVVELGRSVLVQACTQVRAWRCAGVPDLGVSVNVSARQLLDPAFPGHVAAALEASGLPAEALTLEITESMLMADLGTSTARLRRLRATGVTVALDDFGTGYSSLSHLKVLPVDSLKIDKSFVDDLDQGTTVWARAIIGLAGVLGLDVTAEGIEHESQAGVLRELRCHRGQGYLFSRPLPAAEAGRLLAAGGHRAPDRV